jgi:hypothetical protein
MALGSVNVGQSENRNNNYLTTDQVGVAGGLATLNGSGKLTTSQMPEIDHYTQVETDNLLTDVVSAHNSSSNAHADMRGEIAAVKASMSSLELRYGSTVTENPFTVSFASLDGLIVTGIWNKNQARIEF